ncbi:MAG: hypothetical protein ACRDTZ_01235 [Pseudonocardiaceae bacterium]
MSDPNYTAVMLLVDRSGSMEEIREAAEGGINEFINSQRNTTGRRTIRIAQFDSPEHPDETVCPSTDPKDIPRFVLEPRGMTALLDAIGRSIAEFGAELYNLTEDQRPGTVIFAIMTDGLENASREFTWPLIKARLERAQQEDGWQVLYLGANQDAIAVGHKLGVPRGRTMTYTATDHGTRSATHFLSSYVAAAAAGTPTDFTDEQRKDAAS